YQGLGASARARCEAYRGLFSAKLPDDAVTMIRKHTDQCTVVSDKRFRQQISCMLKRRVVRLEHGRDRKGKKYQKRSRRLTP
ncbi:MAG TPA: transposase, partial [Gammaproteobacteria bacterium]|nr:transposase [Gammaproteobacteria bacterium]